MEVFLVIIHVILDGIINLLNIIDDILDWKLRRDEKKIRDKISKKKTK